MRTSTRRQGTLLAALVLSCSAAGCLLKDAPTDGAVKPGQSDARYGDAADGGGGLGGLVGGAGGATGGVGGTTATTGGAGGTVVGIGGAGPADAARDLVDAAGTCSIDNDCKDPVSPTCVGGACGKCKQSLDCTGPAGSVCETASGRCVQCVGGEGCDPASTAPICGTANKCVGCTPGDAGAATGCQSNPSGHQCNTATGACVECLFHSDCPAAPDSVKPICTANKCSPCTSGNDCKTKDPKNPACDTGTGACVQCVTDGDCSGATPICRTNKCVRCTQDDECAKKLGDSPGVCMSHQDGHCASNEETIYVSNGPGCSASATTGGTSATPLCSPQDALTLAKANRRLILLRTVMPFVPINANLGADEVSLISKDGATIDHGASVGIHLVKGQLYVRGVSVIAGSGPGVIADGGTTIRLDRCRILGSGGGLLVNGAGFEITNTIISKNNEALVPPAGPTYGGVYLKSASGKPTVLRFDTIVENQNIGLQCAGPYATSSLIVANNVLKQALGCTPTGAGIDVDPKLDINQHLTSVSPCIDNGDADAPLLDIDGDRRPQGTKSDCGADEFLAR